MDSPSVPILGERERLLEAIVRVAAEKGYGATTVADVLARAGCSREQFDRHFAGKEECFMEAYEAVMDVFVACIAAAFERTSGQPWADRAIASLRAMVELLAAETEIARMAIVEVTALGEEARVRSREGLARLVPFLEEGRAASPQGAELPAETARFAIGGATSMVFDEIRAGRGAELERILPDLVFAVTMPYIGVAAAEREMLRVRESN